MSGSSNVCTNRKAHYEYEILDTLEAGIVLHGAEVKSLRENKCSIDGSYAVVTNGEVWLINSFIDEYKNDSSWQPHEPQRKRKLLLNKKEIHKFAEKSEEKGFTLVPLSVYFRNGFAKIELAVARGKQIHDKRQVIKERDAKREMKE